MASKLTSFDDATVNSGSIVNEVRLTYNTFGQIVANAQSHSCECMPGTTPQVQYAYANGSSRMIRPTTPTHPTSRAITISRGTSKGINDSASRVDAPVDAATTLVNYTYPGLGTRAKTTDPQSSLLHMLLGSSGGASPAGDIYWGLHQRGRVNPSFCAPQSLFLID